MEEVIELLRDSDQSGNFPLELPSEEELVEVEELILIPLPRDLRQFLMKASDVIYGSIEPCTAADPRSHTYLPEMAAQAWDVGMSREYIPVCEYDDGYACIAQDGKIFFWNGRDLAEEWSDFWEWCREVWLER